MREKEREKKAEVKAEVQRRWNEWGSGRLRDQDGVPRECEVSAKLHELQASAALRLIIILFLLLFLAFPKSKCRIRCEVRQSLKNQKE